MFHKLLGCLLALAIVAPNVHAQRKTDSFQRIEELKAEGRRYFARNKLPEALEKFQAVLALQVAPDDELLYNLSFISWELKDCRHALLYSAGFLYVSPGDGEAVAMKERIQQCLDRVGTAGTLNVESRRPESIEVKVEGVIVGRSPVRGLRLTPGRYNIEADSPKFHPYEASVVMPKGGELTHEIKMRRMIFKGNLKVVTDPPDATIYLDHNRAGSAPFERKDLDTRRYLLRIEKKGWDRWVRYITIEKDYTLEVKARLERTGTHVPIPPLPSQDY